MQPPPAGARRAAARSATCSCAQLEATGRRRPQDQAQQCVDDPAMAPHDDRPAGVAGHDVADASADPVVERGHRLATGERHGERVASQSGCRTGRRTRRTSSRRSPARGRARRSRSSTDLGAPESRRDDLGRLDRPGVVAGVQDRRRRARPSRRGGRPGARPAAGRDRTVRCTSRPADRAVHGGDRLPVAHENEAGGRRLTLGGGRSRSADRRWPTELFVQGPGRGSAP